MSKPIDISKLKFFSPLHSLREANLHALVKKLEVRHAKPNEQLFREGDTAKRSIYLLSGTIDLRKNGKVIRTIVGASNDARNPLAPQLPRQCAAVAKTPAHYLSIDSDMLDVMLTWDQTGSYEVSELRNDLEETGDWMTALLRTNIFNRIPPANIQTIFMRLERVSAKAGDVIVKQGDEGDFFYVVTNGRCIVTRETPLNKEGIRLAELEVGDTFGEEALISDAKRNATVYMETDGSLMRLKKEDFQTLLEEPMLDWVDTQQADEIIAAGGQWLDVRLPSEFDVSHKEGAINIPLYFIRLKLKSLNKAVRYVVCCDTGRRSSAGAFILNERGFQTYVLKGGLEQADAESS